MLRPHERALALVGTKFRHQGRNLDVGLDCLGVIIRTYLVQERELARYRMSDGSWDEIERELAPWFDAISSQSEAQCCDLVVYRLPRCFHFGVLCGSCLVHADPSAGRVVARPAHVRGGSACRVFRFREGS